MLFKPVLTIQQKLYLQGSFICNPSTGRISIKVSNGAVNLGELLITQLLPLIPQDKLYFVTSTNLLTYTGSDQYVTLNPQADWLQSDSQQLDYIKNKPSDITTQGNTFNTAGKLVQIRSDGKIPLQLYDCPASTTVTFTSADLVAGKFIKTTQQLAIDNKPVSVQLINNYGVITDADSRLSIRWTLSAGVWSLNLDLTYFIVLGTWTIILGTAGRSDAAGGYIRQVITQDTTALTSHWYVAKNNCRITLPYGINGEYIRVSTAQQADDVLIVPASGQSILGDTTGLVIDKAHGCVLLICDGSMWLIAEAK